MRAVISHVLPDGSERPIPYASKTLPSSECNYAQLEKEAFSLVYGVQRFHSYLYGRPFILYTDDKPLTATLGANKSTAPLAAARLRCWGHYYWLATTTTLCSDQLILMPMQTVYHAYLFPSVRKMPECQTRSCSTCNRSNLTCHCRTAQNCH